MSVKFFIQSADRTMFLYLSGGVLVLVLECLEQEQNTVYFHGFT